MSDLTLARITLMAAIIALPFGALAMAEDLSSDPTRPPAPLTSLTTTNATQADQKLDLRAIFYAKGRRLAVINDQRLSEGDLVGGARVVQILPSHVRMRRAGNDFELRLIGQNVKSTESAQSNAGDLPSVPLRTVIMTSTVEAWGGPSTTPLMNDASDSITPTIPAPTDSNSPYASNTTGPASIADDWDSQPEQRHDDNGSLSGNPHPGLLDALLGEGIDE